LSELLLVAFVLAAGNVWFTMARSAIPLRLDAVATSKEVRQEKHPRRDDVWLIGLEPAGVIQVDEAVFDQVVVGERLIKQRWSRTLRCDEREVELDWSAEARGMWWAMPLAVAVIIAAAAWTAMRT